LRVAAHARNRRSQRRQLVTLSALSRHMQLPRTGCQRRYSRRQHARPNVSHRSSRPTSGPRPCGRASNGPGDPAAVVPSSRSSICAAQVPRAESPSNHRWALLFALESKEDPMARWGDIAQWVGPTPNENSDGMQSVDGVVLHIQDGNQAGSIAWCKNPASQVSAHFFAPKIGQPQQLVDTGDRAWAEAGGNSHWLSIENEGWSGQDPTPDQIEACAHILARAHIIARAQQLLGIATPTPPPPARQAPPWPGRTFVYEGPDTEQISGADVLE